MTDLGTIITNLGSAFPLAVQLTFILLALFGLSISGLAIYQTYLVASEGGRSQHSYGKAAATMVLGSACIVAPFIVWRFANTIALGGNETSNWLSYAPGGAGAAAKYCQDTQFALTGLFMLVGSIAIFYGATILYEVAKQSRGGGVGQASMYIFAGVACIFSNDIATIIGNTIHMDAGMQQICVALGAGTS